MPHPLKSATLRVASGLRCANAVAAMSNSVAVRNDGGERLASMSDDLRRRLSVANHLRYGLFNSSDTPNGHNNLM